MIAKRGAARTERLLRSWMANEPQILGSDVDVLEAIAAGRCDVGLANHYYLGRESSRTSPTSPSRRRGPTRTAPARTPTSRAPASCAASAPRGRRVKLIEYLHEAAAQQRIVENGEFAANPDVPPRRAHPRLGGRQDRPDRRRSAPGALLPDAVALMQRVGLGVAAWRRRGLACAGRRPLLAAAGRRRRCSRCRGVRRRGRRVRRDRRRPPAGGAARRALVLARRRRAGDARARRRARGARVASTTSPAAAGSSGRSCCRWPCRRYVLVFVLLGQYDAAGRAAALRDAVRRRLTLPEIRSTTGTILVLTVVLYPYVYVLARAAFVAQSRADARGGAHARALARRARSRRVALPLARPALAAGAALAVMEALADFGAVNLLGYRALTDAIYRVWYGAFDRGARCSSATVLVVLWRWARGARAAAARRGRATSRRSPAATR